MKRLWTTEQDQMLIALYESGDSMGVIAVKVGAAFNIVLTRSAIAGRKKRLRRCIMRNAGTVITKVKAAPPKPRLPFVPKKALRHPPQVAPPQRIVVEHDRGIEYMKNPERGCKAILDARGKDGLHLCCGRLRSEGSPYCLKHTQMYCSAYHPSRRDHGEVREAG